MGSATTIIFILVVGFFGWRGYQKGFIASITGLLSWLIAYPSAIFFTKPLAKLLIKYTALDGLIVYFVAGATIFLTVSGLVSWLLNRLSGWLPENHITHLSSRASGASLGMVIGAFLGLVAVYCLLLVKKPDINTNPILTNEPPQTSQIADDSPVNKETLGTPVPLMSELSHARESFIESSAKKLMSKAASTAVSITLDNTTATQLTQAFAENPQIMLEHVEQVTHNGKIKELLADEQIQSLLNTGDVAALMRNHSFQELMRDKHMQALTYGVQENNTTGQQAAAETMVSAWTRMQTLKDDPRVRAILEDPKFQQQLNSANKLPLMMNPKLNQLAEIIFTSESSAPKVYVIDNNDYSNDIDLATDIPAADPDEKTPKRTLYHWTDENGQAHYSDKPINR